MDEDDPLANKSSETMTHSASEAVPGLGQSPALTRSVQAQLGQRLRQFYESLALGEQPVPDRFIEIISRIDQVPPGKQQS